MAQQLAKTTSGQISRPLKILIPLIQDELQLGNTAGREHYIQAGRMLNESKGQVSHGGWGRWLDKNFSLSQRQAQEYMLLARKADQMRAVGADLPLGSMYELRGAGDRVRNKQRKAFHAALRDLPREEFKQERQARDDEIKLHRELAEELVDIGFRALATRLHPDRGGSKDAMSRLNRVRDDLKSFAQTRRFV
jgi:uncharacterized membrane protein